MKIILLPTIDFQVHLLSRFTLSLRDLSSPLTTLRNTEVWSPVPRNEVTLTRWPLSVSQRPVGNPVKTRQGKQKLRPREIRETHRPRWISWKKIDETPGMLKVFAFVLLFFCWLCVCFFCRLYCSFWWCLWVLEFHWPSGVVAKVAILEWRIAEATAHGATSRGVGFGSRKGCLMEGFLQVVRSCI